MPSTFTHATETAAPPERVWEALQQPETWAELAGVEQVSDAQHDDDGILSGFDFVVAVGPQRYRGKARTTDYRPLTSMQLAVTSSELTGTLQVTIVGGSSTTVAVTVELSPKGFLSTMFFPAIAAAVGSGLPEQVESLASRLG